MNRTEKSNLFTAYNKARAAAKAGKLDINRVNRALGVAQLSEKRPYETTVTRCNCPDFQRNHKPCKHMIAKMLEVRSTQYQSQSAPIPKVVHENNIYHRFSNGDYGIAEQQKGWGWYLHIFYDYDEMMDWLKNGFRTGIMVHPTKVYGPKRGEVSH